MKKALYEEILQDCCKALPNEACGLLGGRFDGEHKSIERVYPLTNMDNSPEHFSMDPKEQFSAIKDIRNNGWVMLGNYHSHPASPSRPSEEDKRLAFDIEASYLILSLLERERPVLKSFKIQKDAVTEEDLVIMGGE